MCGDPVAASQGRPHVEEETRPTGNALALERDVRCGDRVDRRSFLGLTRTLTREHHQWDAQVGDVAALAPFRLVLFRAAWRKLDSLAGALAPESVAIKKKLADGLDLHTCLGLPPRLARALRADPNSAPTPSAARIMRLGFHGGQVSEVNGDVCGGPTESSRFAEFMANRTESGAVPGDSGAARTDAIAVGAPNGGLVVLLGASGWVEDADVVSHLVARLRARGLAAPLASPHHLRWTDGRARLESDLLKRLFRVRPRKRAAPAPPGDP
jgi:hypothetical protein